MNQQKILRITGLIGMAAALIGFSADVLLYGGFYGGGEFYAVSRKIMSTIPLTRLMLGGALGPIEVIFYIFGFWHIYLALKTGSQWLAQIAFAAFSASFIVGGGAFHSAFVFQGLILRAQNVAEAVDLPVFSSLLTQSSRYMQWLYGMAWAFALVGTIAFVVAILFRKTRYPKWMVFLTPQILVVATPYLFRHIPAPVGGILYGGSVNLSILLFFCVSTALLWNAKIKPV